VLGLTRESQDFPSHVAAFCRISDEGGSGKRKIDTVQSAQVLHFASEFRGGMLERVKQYPESAVRRGAKGTATIGFMLDESGGVASVSLLQRRSRS
jgi:hypothetical protein